MKREYILLICTISVVLLSGCSGLSTPDYNLNETVNDSATVESIHIENVSQDKSQIDMDLKKKAKQNDQHTTVIIIGGIPQTQYYNDWKQVQITNVSVVNKNGTIIHTETGDNLNGSSISVETNNSGYYKYKFKSSYGVSEFGLELKNGTIVDGNSDDKV